MLIESQPQQSTTPPTPQLGLSQSMVSSPSPQLAYDVVDRLKQRVGKYRIHHQISYDKNQNTIEAQNMKMKSETTRLQQQFLNNSQNNTNSNNKSKQQKSVNTSAAQRNANKRSNSSANNSDAKCDSSEPKPTKVAKVANNRNSANSSAKGSQSSPNNQSFRNNCAKFTSNPQSIQIDLKLKTPIDGSGISNTNTQPLIHSNTSLNSVPEIKREIEDNSYLQSVTVEAIHDFLKDDTNTINCFNLSNFEGIGSDDIKDLLNDSNFVEDGLGATNDGFADEDFIKKFLEDINESNDFNEMTTFGQQLNTKTFKTQQTIVNNANHMINGENNSMNCNISVNLLNNNLNSNHMIINTNAMNSNNFMTNSMQTPTNNEMTSYHPIQPRLQPNLMSNIPNRSSIQLINSGHQPIAISSNNTIRYVNSVNIQTGGQTQGQTPQLLLQQIPTNIISQQSLNNANISSQPSQTTHSLQQSSQQIHLRLPTGPTMQRMGVVSVVPKNEDVSVQLSIQVPQQTTQLIPNTTSTQVPQQPSAQSVAAANASIKLKQMAQQVQQKTQNTTLNQTHQWVINHSNPTLTQNALQPINQQIRPQTTQTVVSNQRISSQPPQPQQRQTQQVLSPETQNPNQIQIQIQQQNQNQNYFTPQMNQQMYWQHNQQQQQQHQQIQLTQQQQHPQQTQSQPQHTPPQQLIQQNQQNFANYWSHPSQMGGQTTQQQQTQHYFNNNNNNNNNYNYF